METASVKENAIRRKALLETNRRDWEGTWKDITSYILPRKGRYPGDPANKPVSSASHRVDATATKALRVLASGMQGGLTSPARPWFRLRLPHNGSAGNSAVPEWLAQVEQIFYSAFARSNFYSAIHTLYKEEAAFGTGAVYQEEDPEHGFIFRVLTTGTYALGIGQDARANTLSRTFYMSAANVVQKYGAHAVSNATRELAHKNPDAFVTLHHIIHPRTGHDPEKQDAANMPFASVTWEEGASGGPLSVSGYREFPVLCPRWDVTAEDIYGQGPGTDALPDVKMLQQMAKGEIMAIHKMNAPPMMKPAGMKSRLNLLPGGENVVNATDPASALVRPLYEVRPDISAISGRIRELQETVREWFYNDLFLMLATRPQMTATEVLERREEKMLLLGPVIERQQYELLDPLIERTWGILWRAGKIPPPPREIMGRDLSVEYVSSLAQAQKMMGLQGVESTAGFIAGLAQSTPEVLDCFDSDAAARAHAAMTGAPPDLLRQENRVRKIRRERAEKLAAMDAGAAPEQEA